MTPAAILAGALLLAWPALVNGYPLVFSDTGAFLAQTVQGWSVWDKPLVYGPALHLFHQRGTLWAPLLAQVLAVSWALWLALRVFAVASPGRHLLVCAGLALGTALPWFASQLMPDVFAGVLVLALALLGFGAARLSGGEAWALGALAAFAAAVHLSHLPVAAALVVLALLARGRRAALRCALPVGAAVLLLLATNLWAHGRLAVSPYGSVFALARLVADGPAARTVADLCPAAGWQLCRWAGRLPTDSDAFLWSGTGPVWAPRTDGLAPGGPISLAPEATAIVAATLRREPLAVLRAGLANGWAQLGRVRLGDALGPDNLAQQVGGQLARGFPAAEQARFAAGLQARGQLPAVAAPLAGLHLAVLLLGAAGAVLALLRGRAWVSAILLGVAVNALACGALSGPHDRYQARIAWLLPLAALLARPATASAGGRG